MMLSKPTLEFVQNKLREAAAGHFTPKMTPLDVSEYVAMSILQKSIRRGEEDVALGAAARLLQIAPERLWRRLGCIAFEDIGVGDFEVVSLSVAALGGKRFRQNLGGEWKVASYVASRQAHAIKCRATDDLLMTAEGHPALARMRADLARRSTEDLLAIATGSAPLLMRALAAWFALGTNRWTSRRLPLRSGNPALLFEAFRATGTADCVVEVAREGWKKLSEVLCPLLVLLAPLLGKEPSPLGSDEFPAERYIGEIPGWCLDLYSREGRAALAAFAAGGSETARWVRAHIPHSQQVRFVGGLVFRVEGGLLRSRLRWPVGDELRRIFEIECLGPDSRDARVLIDLMRRDIPELNLARAQTMRALERGEWRCS